MIETPDTLKQLHSSFKTPQSTVYRVVHKATGQIPCRREKIVRGYSNEVYRVETYEGDTFLVRIHRGGGVSFAQEAWALEQARQSGVPVPRVLLTTEAVIGGVPREVMVQEFLPGRPLSESVCSCSTKDLFRIFTQAGEALAKIHRIPAGGFYRRHNNGIWDFRDWDSVMESAVRDRTAEAPLLIGFGIPKAEVDSALSLLELYRESFVCEHPVLCHGDFLPEHLLVDDDGTLTGVLDFGEFQGSTPIHDLAHLKMECPQIDLKWLRFGYLAPEMWNDPQFGTRLLLHTISLQLGYLAHHIAQGWTEEAQDSARGLLGSLNEWRTLV